ncbi:MAG: FAD-dependent oxidoreductase [Spirochaetales bacterium]|uniref:FAD-dependent oxidoreductase n=1 Tax=Candidatus Thalassospirochaeta sargassi TaxID=3119039 RepID=A0AAJ1ILB4_9SPIO|nr:FAD-dependent oxidoreductase [Spirochaetales bacterium]
MPENTDRVLNKVRRRIKKAGLADVQVAELQGSIQLTGRVASWSDKVEAGYMAAGNGFRGVLNDIAVDGVADSEMSIPAAADDSLEGRSFDAVIVGGGVVGCAIARELARYNISIAVLEKESDLAMQASGRNDGMIHPGFAASPGTKKAAYNVRGNRLYTRLAEELDFQLERPGSILLYRSAWMKLIVPVFRNRCRRNGVDGNWRSLSKSEVRRMEPNVTKRQQGGFFLPSAGIVSPFRVTIAFAENAAANGAEFFLNTAVTGVDSLPAKHNQESYITKVLTNRGRISCGLLINAAGVWSDKVAEMAGDRFFSIHGRKGTDAILDSSCRPYQNHITGMPSLLNTKNKHSKGGGLVPCVEGNILLGPTAEEVPGREDYSTDARSFDSLLEQLALNTQFDKSQIINYYSGVRAANWEEDFIIEPSRHVSNLIHAAAIQSPGLASAPAIAEDVAAMAVNALENGGMSVGLRKSFNPRRQGIPCVKEMSDEERSELISRDPSYGEIMCRCEMVSKGEIRDALHSPVPATTVDGVKRRVRAGAGRCHGGFCLPRVIKLMAEETGLELTNITKKGGVSGILCCETKAESYDADEENGSED